MNKHVNHGLKHHWKWLRSNKISLNVIKIEIIIFQHKPAIIITKHLNFRVSGQKGNTTTIDKYLGVYLNDFLTWERYFKNLIPKLKRAIGILCKVRHHTPNFLLKAICYSLFNSHLIYASQISGQISSRSRKLQSKAI